jgi:hypothetical protein
MIQPDPGEQQRPFRVYHFFLHRCVIARSETEARDLAAEKWQPTGRDMFTVIPLEREGEMFVEAPPDEVIYSPEIADQFHMLFKDEDFRDRSLEGHLFSKIDDLNRTLAQIRAATAQPSDVPPMSSLEVATSSCGSSVVQLHMATRSTRVQRIICSKGIRSFAT